MGKQLYIQFHIGCIQGAFTGGRRVKTKFKDKSEAKLTIPGTVFQQKLMKSDKHC